jgi:hypothetical protein
MRDAHLSRELNRTHPVLAGEPLQHLFVDAIEYGFVIASSPSHPTESITQETRQ